MKSKQQKKTWADFNPLTKLFLIALFVVSSWYGHKIGYHLADMMLAPLEKKASATEPTSAHGINVVNKQSSVSETLFAKCLRYRQQDGMADDAAQASCRMYSGM